MIRARYGGPRCRTVCATVGHTCIGAVEGVTMTDVRAALRHELESRGLVVADDTVASRGELYVKGSGDLASSLFEFKNSAAQATETMYQGNWTEGLPPRFAVLPAEAASEPMFELLEQMRIHPLLYEVTDDSVTFLDLDTALERQIS